MINRYTLSAAAMLLASAASATNYFFTPEGSGEKDGTSWANAADQTGLIDAITALQAGDVLCMGAGTFATTKAFNIPEGVTILGGFTTDLQTGVNIDINYKNLTAYTVWNAEKTAMSSSFVTIAQDDVVNNKGTKTYEQYQRTTLAGIEIINTKLSGGDYRSAAILVQHADVELHHLLLKDNESLLPTSGTRRGGALTLWGAYAYVHDCIFEHNCSQSTGVAIHSRAHNSDTKAGAKGGCVIIDRCQITDNYPLNQKANYGGAMAIADYGGIIYMNNSTVSGTDIGSYGGAVIRVGTESRFVTTNCTFLNCVAKNLDNNKYQNGDMISLGSSTNYKSANTICVNKEDGKATTFSMITFQNNTGTFSSGGNNVFGSFYSANPNVKLVDSDMSNNELTTDKVFGSADPEMTVVNGTGVFEPLEFFRKVNTADVVANTKDWDLPEVLNLTVDQTGKKRPNVTVPGAFDVKSIVTTGIESIAADDSKLTLRSVGNGIFVIEGAEDLCEAYDLAGRRVAVALDGTIDLSGSAVGFYIVRCGNKAVKIVR